MRNLLLDEREHQRIIHEHVVEFLQDEPEAWLRSFPNDPTAREMMRREVEALFRAIPECERTPSPREKPRS